MRTAIPSLPQPDQPLPALAPPAPVRRYPRRARRGTAAVMAVLVPAAAMLGTGLWGLDRGTLWRDEATTFQAAQRTLPQMWQLLGGVDAVHGLYYLLMHAVLAARPDEVTLRLPSLLAAVCTAGLVGALGRRLIRPRAGLWAGLLYAGTPIVSRYAQEGRSYALVAAGAALATLLLVRAVEYGSARRWAAYGAATAVTALLHEFAVLLLAAHAVTLLASRVPPRTRRCWAAAAGATVAVLLPLVVLSRRQDGQVSWIRASGRRDAVALLYDFAGPSGLVLAVNLLLIAAALIRPLPRDGFLGPVAVALPLAVVPPVLLLAVSRWEPLFVDRYVLFALAGVPLLVAAGAEALLRGVRPLRLLRRQRPVALAGAAAVGAAFLWQLPLHERARQPAGRQDDLAAVAALVREETRPGDALLFVPSHQRRVALAYPRDFAGRRDLALSAPVAPSGTLEGREVQPGELRERLGGADRVWVVAVPGVEDQPWFRGSRREQAKLTALREHFTEVSAARVRSGTVALHVRDGLRTDVRTHVRTDVRTQGRTQGRDGVRTGAPGGAREGVRSGARNGAHAGRTADQAKHG
ncbi:glycosyltransferase family 39 protein [Streptomyces sp. NPDC004647]|uniref:glycosyltransferase family 39 protein n=1 Tax=Streptomyces sp. NPDC004647 TaxID=3154671 RepID=UPI0033BD6D52